MSVWDADSGAELRTLKGNKNSIFFSVSFSPDGRRMAAATWDQTIKLWDADSGTELRTFKGHTGEVRWVSFSPDGRRLASACNDETIKLWDADSGAELRTLKGHTANVLSVSFSPDGRRLASASDDRTIKLWDADSGAELRTFKGHTANVWSVSFSPEPGARLDAALHVPKDGDYEVLATLTMAPDYAIVQLALDGQPLGELLDLYNAMDVISTGEIRLPAQKLTAGRHLLSIEIKGANPSAVKAYMVGLDYVRLVVH